MRVPQFFISWRVKNPGSWAGVPCGLLSKFPGWNVAQSGVRTTLVIVFAPSFDLALGVVKGKEPVSIQTLVAEPSVERFNQGIGGWFSRTVEVERDLMQVGPLVECARNKLGP